MSEILLQDLPFLIVRVVLITRFDVINYTNLFFTAKNCLVVLFLLYRVAVIRSEAVDTHGHGADVLLGEKTDHNARLAKSKAACRKSKPDLPLTTYLLTQDGGRIKNRSKLRGHSEPR